MNNVLKFSVDNIELLDNIEKSLFRKVRIKAFASGENAHTLPIEEETIIRNAKSVYNKPILWKYDRFLDDAMSHEVDEVPCGFVPESNNPIEFLHDDVYNKTFMVINALLWTKYCGRLIEIFKRDDMHKDVSIEIATIEDDNVISDKPKIKDFVVAGITILGELINPACKGCEAELLAFAEDQKTYLSGMDCNILIDDSNIIEDEWINPRRKLFSQIVKCSNKRDLMEEAYLLCDFNQDDFNLGKFSYPHHIVRDNKLILHRGGLERAFNMAKSTKNTPDEVFSHIAKHYIQLGMNNENFCDFNISKEDFDLYFADKLVTIESVGESCMADEIKKDEMACGEEKEACGCEKEACGSVDNCNMGDEPNAEEKVAETTEEKMEEDNPEDGPEDKEEEEKEEKDDDDDDDDDEKEEKMSDVDAKMAELSSEVERLKAENDAYMAKINEMADYAELKKFKENTEAEKAREKEMAEMQKVMSEIESRGINMSDEDKQSLMSKISEFTSIEAWANFAKAQVFDRVENVDGVTRIGLPFANHANSGSIWDRI